MDALVYKVAANWRQWLRGLPARIGTTLLPPRCLLCGEPGDDGRDMCAACHWWLPRNHCACPRCAIPLAVPGTCGRCLRREPLLHFAHAAFVYAPPVDGLLARYKFHGDLAAGRLLAGLLAETLDGVERPQALVPVPLHRSRLRQRGYDQALELARPLARATGVPLAAGLLQRHRRTAAQSELGAMARRRNLRGAFRVAARGRLPAHVALVDDVMTTGATLHAAALALRRAGVERVDAWICARTP